MEEEKTFYRLNAFNRWGYQCANYEYPNKTKAIQKGRELKRNGYAFSYIVYEVYYKNNKRMRRQIARG